ncbi:hypothetical protein PENSPDRAFT_610035 [Peniophora sp. CONT]|nr:hypothetical protein PENSPDRAFT_610035 [Peniophora sp. CONT]
MQTFMNAPPVPVRYYAQYLSHRNVHELHTGCPSSLSCLADTDAHPDASYETLVRCAILGSSEANQQLPVHEILAALKGKYPYFRSEEAGRALEQAIMMTFAISPAFVKNTSNLGEVLWAVSTGPGPMINQAPPQSLSALVPPSPYAFQGPSAGPSGDPFAQTPSGITPVDPGAGTGPSDQQLHELYAGPFAYREHNPHPDCPNALSCLADTTDRPGYTYPILVKCAILGSAHRRLEIREIYQVLSEKYPFFKADDKTWKQSIRHCLSLHASFVPTKRPIGAPGWGSWWTYDEDATGTKRPRKRGPKAAGKGQDKDAVVHEDEPASAHAAGKGTGAGAGMPSRDQGDSTTGTDEHDEDEDAEGEEQT